MASREAVPVLQAVEVGLLQGLVDVEVGALAQRRARLGRGLWGVGAGPAAEWCKLLSGRLALSGDC